MKRRAAALGLAAMLLAGCAAYDAVMARLGIVNARFALSSVDVSHLVYPGNFLQFANLSAYGVDVRCRLEAQNPNSNAVVFDGAAARLRVMNTSASDPSVSAGIPGFNIAANGTTAFDVTFPLRLNSPIFTKSVWKGIIKGEDMPYKIDADLQFKLANPTTYKILDSLGTRTLRLDVVKGSVNSRATGSAIVNGFLALIDRVL